VRALVSAVEAGVLRRSVAHAATNSGIEAPCAEGRAIVPTTRFSLDIVIFPATEVTSGSRLNLTWVALPPFVYIVGLPCPVSESAPPAPCRYRGDVASARREVIEPPAPVLPSGAKLPDEYRIALVHEHLQGIKTQSEPVAASLRKGFHSSPSPEESAPPRVWGERLQGAAPRQREELPGHISIDPRTHTFDVDTHLARATDRAEDKIVRVRHIEADRTTRELRLPLRSVPEHRLAAARFQVLCEDSSQDSVRQHVPIAVQLRPKLAGFRELFGRQRVLEGREGIHITIQIRPP
jgi:hypothetical protein